MEKQNLISYKINEQAYDIYIKKFFKKNTSYCSTISSIIELSDDYKQFHNKTIFKFFFLYSRWFGMIFEWNTVDIMTSNVVMKDLLNYNKSWRAVKGYPVHGQKTHTNSNNCKKLKLLFNYRLEQFFQLFGHRKRNIYPTLILGEYVNKLWFNNWRGEWGESFIYALELSHPKTQVIPFDPVSLAKNQTNGYLRTGSAAKIGKAKKITKVVTIGIPIFFSRFIYYERLPKEFPYRLWISDDDRRKMGRKSKKNLKKKKIC